MQEERQAWFRELEKHARCALLPSPDKLDESIGSPGSDKTDTLKDFELVKDWLTNEQLLNVEFHDTTNQRKQLEECTFRGLLQHAFSSAFVAMHNTAAPELEELVFWYYAGHGLDKEKAKQLPYSSTPCLEKVNVDFNYYVVANDFVKEGRKVTGGELYLHEAGFCDLYGLLKPWIAAVKSESKNAKGIKKNKHLVIILDSCHSGIIAQELIDFKSQTEEKVKKLLSENTVTIQAACGPNERTFGGYFTPCFVYLNDPKNEELLVALKNEWEEMSEDSRKCYRSIDLPSPMVVTTVDKPESVTMERTVQNFKLTLFPDPEFFKFCSIKVFHDQQEKSMKSLKDRVLDANAATTFMKSLSFTVLDYKLKPYKGTGPTDPNAGTPMGLFLLDDPNNPGFAVCAHIHFKRGDTKCFQKIKLVHHKKPPMDSTLYVEDGHGPKIEVPNLKDANATKLYQACRDYVNSKEPGRWEDVSQWNMTGKQVGVNKLFRLQERSAWEDAYLKHIEKYNLPKVADTDKQPIVVSADVKV